MSLTHVKSAIAGFVSLPCIF